MGFLSRLSPGAPLVGCPRFVERAREPRSLRVFFWLVMAIFSIVLRGLQASWVRRRQPSGQGLDLGEAVQISVYLDPDVILYLLGVAGVLQIEVGKPDANYLQPCLVPRFIEAAPKLLRVFHEGRRLLTVVENRRA